MRKISDAQCDFVLHLGRALDSIANTDRDWVLATDIADSYFGQVFRASAAEDDLELARVSAQMVLQLWHAGVTINLFADLWMTNFGHLFVDTNQSRLTKDPLFS